MLTGYDDTFIDLYGQAATLWLLAICEHKRESGEMRLDWAGYHAIRGLPEVNPAFGEDPDCMAI